MPEGTVLESEVKTINNNNEPKVSGLGKPERVTFSAINLEETETEIVNNTQDQTTSEADANTKTNAALNTTPADLTEDQVKSFFESKGIKYEGIDKLKEKIDYKPPVEFTPEQISEQQKVREKRAVDLFIKGGGTVENYVAIKSVAESNLAELSNASLKKELTDAGFNEDQVKEIIKDRYYQFEDKEIEQEDDETDKEFKKRSKEFFSKKLENRSIHIKTQAQNILKELNSAIESEDLGKQNEVATSAKIDDYFNKVSRKLSFDIGEINGTAVSPVVYEVSDSDIAEVKEELKDTAKRNNFLYNQDGNLNLTNIANVMLRNKYLESVLKSAYHEGGSRQIDEFRKTFPATTAQQLGIGGSPVNTNSNNKVASYGKVQKVSSHQHN